ncbi:MAG: copper resistance protein NlpE [Treponema sp.]|jgi:uncharacterized lipoprotein NlpE involved in copper resistance|nr:copper resistance protein NlpE [Treponema sp.]
MKKKFLVTIISLLLLGFISCGTTGRSSEKSSDWAGIYTGVIPAADAEGINVRITLKTNETYTVEYQYIGKSNDVFTNTGTFNWNTEKNTVILVTEREGDFPKYYKLGKNTLTQLDMAGNIITGEFADNYILKKQ